MSERVSEWVSVWVGGRVIKWVRDGLNKDVISDLLISLQMLNKRCRCWGPNLNVWGSWTCSIQPPYNLSPRIWWHVKSRPPELHELQQPLLPTNQMPICLHSDCIFLWVLDCKCLVFITSFTCINIYNVIFIIIGNVRNTFIFHLFNLNVWSCVSHWISW